MWNPFRIFQWLNPSDAIWFPGTSLHTSHQSMYVLIYTDDSVADTCKQHEWRQTFTTAHMGYVCYNVLPPANEVCKGGGSAGTHLGEGVSQHALRQTPPCGRLLPRAVCILLECILFFRDSLLDSWYAVIFWIMFEIVHSVWWLKEEKW